MKNLDNIWIIGGRADLSFFLEKVRDGYSRHWIFSKNYSYITFTKEEWQRYNATDTGWHKSEIEAYRLYCKL